MKNIIILLSILSLSLSVRAEYNGYHIKFSIETTNGKANTGYAYVASAYLINDSLNSTNYLKKALNQSSLEWNKPESLTYFKERIKYEYRHVGDSLGPKHPIYALNTLKSISYQEIKSIAIVEMIDYTYLTTISNSLSISDSNWIKKEPVYAYSFGGYLCYHQIFIHINSKSINKIIKLLQTKQYELIDVDINQDNGDKIDEDFWEIIIKLNNKKVVIVTECTC